MVDGKEPYNRKEIWLEEIGLLDADIFASSLWFFFFDNPKEEYLAVREQFW